MENAKARFFLNHALQRGYSWANFDLPCHGRSEGRFEEFRVSTALTAVIEVIQQFRGAPVMLLGASMGAWLSMAAARKLANSAHVDIAGAVLVAPAFDFFQQYFHNESADVMRQWRRDGVRRFFDHYDNRPYRLSYAVLQDGVRHNLLDRSGNYNFPIRIFHGDKDEIVPLGLSHRFQAMAPGSDIAVEVIEDGDHALTEHLARVATGIDGMFAQVKAPEAV